MTGLKNAKRWIRNIRKFLIAPKFGNEPKDLRLRWPWAIRNPERIFFGNSVHLGPNTVLKAIISTGELMQREDGLHVEQEFDSKIVFGNRVSATADLHIAAHSTITIEDDVMLASNVFMSDAVHGYERMDIPFKYQGMIRKAPILIRQGSWIGQNVVIMPGVTIGEMSIVGANSVVTRDIPNRSIAVGSPARVIKRWSGIERRWISVEQMESSDSALSESA